MFMPCSPFNMWSNGKALEDSTVRQLDRIILSECVRYGPLTMTDIYCRHMQVEAQDVPG